MLDFFGGIFGGLGSILSDVQQFLSQLLSLLIQGFAFIGQVLLQVVTFFAQAIGKLFGLLRHVWDFIVKDVLAKILKYVQIAHAWLEAHLRPVINFLKKVRALYDRWYRLYVRPYLQMIQRLRRYIAILRLLHIHFADWLDKKLAAEEAFVSKTVLTIRGYLNQVIDTVNALTDPPKLARFIVASLSGRRAAAAMSKMLTGLPIGHWFPRDNAGAFPFEKPFVSSSDYRDPQRNPDTVTLLAGLFDNAPLSVDSPDGVPTDDQLSALETVPYGDDYVSQLELMEAATDALTADELSIYQAIVNDLGPLADAGKGAASFVAALAASGA